MRIWIVKNRFTGHTDSAWTDRKDAVIRCDIVNLTDADSPTYAVASAAHDNFGLLNALDPHQEEQCKTGLAIAAVLYDERNRGKTIETLKSENAELFERAKPYWQADKPE